MNLYGVQNWFHCRCTVSRNMFSDFIEITSLISTFFTNSCPEWKNSMSEISQSSHSCGLWVFYGWEICLLRNILFRNKQRRLVWGQWQESGILRQPETSFAAAKGGNSLSLFVFFSFWCDPPCDWSLLSQEFDSSMSRRSLKDFFSVHSLANAKPKSVSESSTDNPQ